jgi:hypothetical protein
MAGVAPLDLAATLQALALILDGQRVDVIGLDVRTTYPHESAKAVITVSAHLRGAQSIDQVGDLLGLGEDPVTPTQDLYHRSGAWLPGVHLSLYGSSRQSQTVAGVAS